MPDGFPPYMNPDNAGFDTEADLDRLARFIYARRSGIALSDLDTMFQLDPSLLIEFEAVKDSLRRPPARPTTFLNSGVRIFEVTESPEGEFVDQHGTHFAIVNRYDLRYVPNRPRQTIAPWAAFGQRKD